MDEEVLPTEETHDIYAWTTRWNGDDAPIFNCSIDVDGVFEDRMFGKRGLRDVTKAGIIYFFGEKE